MVFLGILLVETPISMAKTSSSLGILQFLHFAQQKNLKRTQLHTFGCFIKWNEQNLKNRTGKNFRLWNRLSIQPEANEFSRKKRVLPVSFCYLRKFLIFSCLKRMDWNLPGEKHAFYAVHSFEILEKKFSSPSLSLFWAKIHRWNVERKSKKQNTLYCPVMLSHFSPAPVKTDRAVRLQ